MGKKASYPEMMCLKCNKHWVVHLVNGRRLGTTILNGKLEVIGKDGKVKRDIVCADCGEQKSIVCVYPLPRSRRGMNRY